MLASKTSKFKYIPDSLFNGSRTSFLTIFYHPSFDNLFSEPESNNFKYTWKYSYDTSYLAYYLCEFIIKLHEILNIDVKKIAVNIFTMFEIFVKR